MIILIIPSINVTPDKYRDVNVTHADLPAERTTGRVPEEGILKRSSAFLASLAQPSSKPVEDNTAHDVDKFLRPFNDYELHHCVSSSKHSGLKGYFTILSSGNDTERHSLQRLSNVRTLLSTESWRKKGASVKKSVSFSSDTSFEEKRSPYKRSSAVHEAKIYHKGVLQGEFFIS